MRRLTRPAHYLAAAQARQALEQVAYLERACAHILSGWIVKAPRLDVKIEWGKQLAADMEHSSRLRDRTRALQAGGDAAACIPESWRQLFCTADESKEALVVMQCLYDVKRDLVKRYSEYLRAADPVADSGSVDIVESARRASESQIEWMKRRTRRQGVAALRMSTGTLARAFKGQKIAADAALWGPLDRVPRVVRPKGMRRGEAGALRLLPIHPRPRKDTGLFLHNFLNEEFATLELVARNSYEHPEMPWSFHRDAARHASDEARHAQMFMRALPEYGIRYGDYPIYTYSYEGEYEFPGTVAVPGSGRELLWRILLRQVVHEGLALDSTPFEIRKREYLRQPELARLFGYILADEVFHAGAGVKWARHLLGGDEQEFIREREKAYAYYSERLKHRRLTWGATHIQEAAMEAAQLAELARHQKFPFKIQVNAAARKRAGYSDEDIRRISEARKK
jgi:uncharacterized ferritin-like protein (DUF455 family)